MPRLKDIGIGAHLFPLLDVVLLLYRPEYYGVLKDVYGNSNAGQLQIIIAKERHIIPNEQTVKFPFYEIITNK